MERWPGNCKLDRTILRFKARDAKLLSAERFKGTHSGHTSRVMDLMLDPVWGARGQKKYQGRRTGARAPGTGEKKREIRAAC